MISRRSLLVTGVGLAALGGAVALADATHRLDDVARAAGVEPRPKPAAGDDLLITSVVRAQNDLLAAVEATAARHASLARPLRTFIGIGQAHVTAVGGSGRVPGAIEVASQPSAATRSLAKAYARESTARAKDAERAVSPDLARVLASMSAGLAQCARSVGDLP